MASQGLKGSRKLAAVLEEIARATGLDVSKAGSSVTVLNSDGENLVLTVKGPNLIEAGHFGAEEETGKPLADPAVLYFTGRPELGWGPLTYVHDYTGENLVTARVTGGQVEVCNPALLHELLRFSNDWAQQLRHQGYLRAAAQADAGAAEGES